MLPYPDKILYLLGMPPVSNGTIGSVTQGAKDSPTLEDDLAPEDIALLATVRWEGTPGSIDSLERGKILAKEHPLLKRDFKSLVREMQGEPVPGQKTFLSQSDSFSDLKFPSRQAQLP